MRKVFVAGNWKMHTDRDSAVALVKGLAEKVVARDGLVVAVCPPAVYLDAVLKASEGTVVKVGAQNCHYESKGAFTGEIAPQMLTDIGCDYVILGHSERRHVFGEPDALVAKKVVAGLDVGLKVILCVGELLEEREGGTTEQVVARQIEAGLFGLSDEQMGRITVAYEPVWAIGTGKTATPDDAQQVHAFIRKMLADKFGAEVADGVSIQYGGSVKPENAFDLLSQPDIDGSLVGGASLKVDSFAAIVSKAVEAKKLA